MGRAPCAAFRCVSSKSALILVALSLLLPSTALSQAAAKMGSAGKALPAFQVQSVTAGTAAPTSTGVLFGGAGDQRGTAIVVANGAIYVTGNAGQSQNSGDSAILASYALPFTGSTAWSRTYANGTAFFGVAATSEGVYADGWNYSLTSDPAGGKEVKTFIAKFPLDGSNGVATGGATWDTGGPGNLGAFFTYGGVESFNAATTQNENGTTYIYAAGGGQPCSYGAYIVAKYDTSGAYVAAATDSTVNVAFNTCSVPSGGGGSGAQGVVTLNGNVYAIGGSGWNFEDPSGGRPAIWKYNSSLSLQSRFKDSDLFGGYYAGTVFGGAIYAVGYTTTTPGVTGSFDYLIEKWDESGNRLWSKSSGGSNDDVLYGVVGIGNYLYAVGYTKSDGSGGADAVVLQIDPTTGNTVSTTHYGGANDDFANGVATDGTDLYVVGETRSFADPDGNTLGQNDAFVLDYKFPTLAVTSPNGSESWTAGTTHTIQWTYQNQTGNVNVVLLKGGTPVQTLANNVSIGSGGNGSFDWAIPANQTVGADYSIEIDSIDNANLKDSSDANFSVTAPSSITVTAPNGGESWQEGVPHLITWNYNGLTGNVVISLLRSGVLYSTINAGTSIGAAGSGSYSWSPSIALPIASDYTVQVTSASDGAILDTSDAPFSLTAPPVITVTSPNGAEAWTVGTMHTITWTYTAGLTGNVNIALLKAGSGYMTIASGVSVGSAGSGSYNWTLPVTLPDAGDYTVRISGVSYPGIVDTSDASFSIKGTLTDVSPNGGESWAAGTAHTIQWTYQGLSGNVNISLLKGGLVSSSIGTVPVGSGGSGSYSWSIPANQPVAGDYGVRVTSALDPSVSDDSNATFSVTAAPTISVVSPNGGESYAAGSVHTIQWSYSGLSGTVNITLLKAGAGYLPIANGVSIGSAGTGSYAWTVPTALSLANDYTIRVSSTSVATAVDVSNAPFTVTAGIQVVSANGGESWAAGSTHTIQWKYDGVTGNVNVALLKAGLGYLPIANGVPIGSGGNGSVTWTVPMTVPISNDYTVRVMSATNNTILDVSDAPFSLTQGFQVLSPNGGENWAEGTTHTISWKYDGATGNANMVLVKGGVGYMLIATVSLGTGGGPGTFTYNWTVPTSLPIGSDYTLRVANAIALDSSDAPFSITPGVHVTAPNGGESWAANTTHAITWKYNGLSGTVNLALLKAGAGYMSIASGVPVGSSGTGSYNWTLPISLPVASDYSIRVSSTSVGTAVDTTDAPFSVTAGVQVTSPNGGESFAAGTVNNIQWKYDGLTGNVNIALLKGGSGYLTIASGVPVGSGGSGSYPWTVPPGIPLAGDYAVRITSATNSNISDTSDATFAVAAMPTITVTAPTSGTNWTINASHPITWTYTGNPGATVKLELLKGGASDSQTPVISASVPVGSGGVGSFTWPVSATQLIGSNYQVRVTSVPNPLVTTTGAAFTLSLPGAITVAAPNGSENWTIGTTNNITWTYTGSPGNNVKIDLYKGGVFLAHLVASTPLGSSGSGSYSWPIDPALGVVAGTDYQVHISAVDVPQISDSSNANFTLKAPPGTITVTAPAAGAVWTRGILPHRITWTYTETTPGSLAGAMVNISLCEGTTCSLIATANIGSGGAGTYSWTISQATALASDYHIKVTVTTNFAVTGNSGVFTIKSGTL